MFNSYKLYAIGLSREGGGCGGRGQSWGPGAVVEGRGCSERGVLYWECQGCVALAISPLHFSGCSYLVLKDVRP